MSALGLRNAGIGAPPVDNSPDIQKFGTASATYAWVKPDGAKWVELWVFGTGPLCLLLAGAVADDMDVTQDVVVVSSTSITFAGSTHSIGAGNGPLLVTYR